MHNGKKLAYIVCSFFIYSLKKQLLTVEHIYPTILHIARISTTSSIYCNAIFYKRRSWRFFYVRFSIFIYGSIIRVCESVLCLFASLKGLILSAFIVFYMRFAFFPTSKNTSFSALPNASCRSFAWWMGRISGE